MLRPVKHAILSLAIALGVAWSAQATPFTINSPINGGTTLPGGVTQVGGIVLQLEGLNGAIVTSQLPAASLFVGNTPFSNPLVIGTQTGFTPAILAALGGGIAEASVRITLFDGDTAAGNFDFNDNSLQLNGVSFGNFSSVVTQQTNNTGTTAIGANSLGFADNQLWTGFFYSNNLANLATLFTTISGSGNVVFQYIDSDPGDQFLDFTQGVNGGLINVGQGPTLDVVPEPASMLAWGLIMGVGAVGYRLQKKVAAKAA